MKMQMVSKKEKVKKKHFEEKKMRKIFIRVKVMKYPYLIDGTNPKLL